MSTSCIRRFFSPYDGSIEGRLALPEGAKLAQFCGAEVFLLAVVEPSFGATLEGGVMIPMDQQFAAYQAIHAEGVERLKGMGFSPTARLGMGAAGRQIAEVAEEIGARRVLKPRLRVQEVASGFSLLTP